MTTYDSDFVALGGGGNPPAEIGFFGTGENNIKVGGLLYGYHIGVQGSATSEQVPAGGANFGVVGTVLPSGPDWVAAHAGAGIGVYGTSQSGVGVGGTSSYDAGVLGQNGDVYVISAPAGVVGSSQYNPGVSGVSSFGNGVTGASDTGSGVFGHSNKAAAVIGISGEGFGFSGGPAIGIIGISNAAGPQFAAPAGVVGTSAQNQGVLGTSSSSSGVVGISGAPPTQNYAGAIAGIVGASHQQPGVYGVSDIEFGVLGTSFMRAGVAGSSEDVGVYGSSDSGAGMSCRSNSYLGLLATSNSYLAVFAASGDWGPYGRNMPNTIDSVAGVQGTSANHIGVLGTSNNEAGVAGYSKGAVGVYGETGAAGGNAGFFRGNLLVTGTKSAAVPFPDGTHRALYCMESPENWFEDFGTAKLKRGRAVVKLDADFAKAIKTGDYRVFLTPEGDCGGLYIKSKRGGGFEVRELQGGTSNVAFSYRIVGRRRDIKRHKRFARIDITPPMQVVKSRALGHTAARTQAFARKLHAAMEKHVAALAAKPARGRKVRSRRQRKARA